MFAVQGWSLGEMRPAQNQPQPTSSTTKKRKRKARAEREARNAEKIKQGNNNTDGSRERQSKSWKGQQSTPKANSGQLHEAARRGATQDVANDGEEAKLIQEARDTRDMHKQRKRKIQDDDASSVKCLKASSENALSSMPPNPPPPTSSKLTPLQTAMRQKLSGARFRHLNEMLYTTSSDNARTLIESDPTIFDEYHSGFRQQVASWPENPIDSYMKDLMRRGKIRGSGKANAEARDAGLPRNKGICTVADCGCGDAALAQKLSKEARKLAVNVLSYDLHGNSSLVTKADIANLPLPDGSVNVAIFCLALMGTNWIDFVEEAWRVLHRKGELWVAEIKSRFAKPRKQQVVDHSVGKRRKKGAKKTDEEDDADQEEALRVHVDGEGRQSSETDVSAFVQVLQRRGFSLQRGGGIDTRNKLFVKMRFIKNGVPGKGKHAAVTSVSSQAGKGQRAVTESGGEGDSLDESSVLKPCLYKVR